MEYNDKNPNIWRGIAIGAIVAGIAGFGINYTQNKIPKDEHVQEGYIAPSNLEIKCKDLDGDGKKETTMNIGNREYRLEKNEEGEPVLSPYND